MRRALKSVLDFGFRRTSVRPSSWCDMIESISRPKLPRGRSYVLKTSRLADALAVAAVGWHVDLAYWTPRASGSILEGQYLPPNENVPYPRLYVRAGTVPTEMRAAAAAALDQTALPQFVRWAQGLMALPAGSPLLAAGSYFNATFTSEGLAISHQPVYKRPRGAR
jgi:hypothetical protein